MVPDAADGGRGDAGASGCLAAATLEQLDSWRESYVRAMCESWRRCSGSDAATCIRYVAPARAVLLPRRGLVSSGEVGFDPEAARRCLEFFTEASCGSSVRTAFPVVGDIGHAVCNRVFPPRCPKAEGERCDSSIGCGGGLYCDPEFPRLTDEMCVADYCTRRTPPGGDCAVADCDAQRSSTGLAACLDVEGGGERRCYEVEYLSAAAPGEPCEIESVDGGRIQVRPCEPLLACRSVGPGGYRCSGPPGALGEPCQRSAAVPCEPPLTCDEDVCSVAEPMAVAGVGEECEPGGLCDTQLTTRCVEGRCVRAGHEVGAPCDRLEGPLIPPEQIRSYCEYPLLCDPTTDRCVEDAILPEDELCNSGSDCRSGCCGRDLFWSSCRPAACCP